MSFFIFLTQDITDINSLFLTPWKSKHKRSDVYFKKLRKSKCCNVKEIFIGLFMVREKTFMKTYTNVT